MLLTQSDSLWKNKPKRTNVFKELWDAVPVSLSVFGDYNIVLTASLVQSIDSINIRTFSPINRRSLEEHHTRGYSCL